MLATGRHAEMKSSHTGIVWQTCSARTVAVWYRIAATVQHTEIVDTTYPPRACFSHHTLHFPFWDVRAVAEHYEPVEEAYKVDDEKKEDTLIVEGVTEEHFDVVEVSWVADRWMYGFAAMLGYALCVLDYEFQILDNAFLVHKPGIKTLKKDPQRAMLSSKTNALIKKVIFPELKVLYGTRKGCAV
uniref:Uncharacterized protein n=1 Tax=Timema poppense TaxID=170557 RepID=A0A7R9GWW5_TIMPO|nr:unnamed protein product [Timema poppensis]